MTFAGLPIEPLPRERTRRRLRWASVVALVSCACNVRPPAGEPTPSAGAGTATRAETPAMTPDPGRAGSGGGAMSPAPTPANELDAPGRATPVADPASPVRPEPGPGIVLQGRGVWVDGEPLLIRGVCWNPVRAGSTHPAGLDFAGFAGSDVPLLAGLGVNVVRTYEPLLDRAVLDRLWAAGIFVIDAVYPSGGSSAEDAVARVRAVKDHPAILMWAIGNEWNYNGLYTGLSLAEAAARLNQVAAAIHAEDSEHPVATIHGELPSAATLAALPNVDVWGINAYRGIGFGNLFDAWRALSDRPMFLSEYGADAYNADIPAYDPASQALAVTALTEELTAHAVARGDAGVTLGGTVFELADEWWKDASGSPSRQDVGGNAPGGGPFPDRVFNEEWWGLVDMQRQPRAAYAALRDVFLAVE